MHYTTLQARRVGEGVGVGWGGVEEDRGGGGGGAGGVEIGLCGSF